MAGGGPGGGPGGGMGGDPSVMGGMGASGGGGGGGDFMSQLLMMNPRYRQMQQGQTQQREEQRQQAVKALIGKALMSGMSGGSLYSGGQGPQQQGQGMPGMPGQNGPMPQMPSPGQPSQPAPLGMGSQGPIQGPMPAGMAQQGQGPFAPQQGSIPPKPPVLGANLGKSLAQPQMSPQSPGNVGKIGLDGKPIGPNPTIGDYSDTQALPRMPQAPGASTPGGMGRIGASFDPNMGGGGSMDRYRTAIDAVEGGRASAMGPVTRRGDRAYGGEQIMGANIPQWTKEALGTSLTPQQFLGDRSAQIKTFNYKFGQYVKETGSPQAAALKWFTGSSSPAGLSKTDATATTKGTSGQNYVNIFNRALEKGPSSKEAGIVGLLPEGQQAMGQAQNKQLDWRTATQLVAAGTPNAKPEEVADAVTAMIPFMNQDSQAQWHQINQQMAQQRIEESKRSHDLTSADKGEQRATTERGQDMTAEGREKALEFQKEKFSQQQDLAKQKIEMAKTRLKDAEDKAAFYKEKVMKDQSFAQVKEANRQRQVALKNASEARKEITSSENALANLQRSFAPEMDVKGAREQVASAKERAAAQMPNIRKGGMPATARPGEGTAQKPKQALEGKQKIPEAQIANIKSIIAANPTRRSEIIKDIEAHGFDASGL